MTPFPARSRSGVVLFTFLGACVGTPDNGRTNATSTGSSSGKHADASNREDSRGSSDEDGEDDEQSSSEDDASTGASADAGRASAARPATPDAGRTTKPELKQPEADSILKDSCAKASVQSELLPANIMIVLDRSGSMNCNPPPTTQSAACESEPGRADPDEPSKWEITKDALLGAVRKLPASASVGISYFSNDDSCGVSSTPNVALDALDQAQVAALKSSLDDVKPNGGTPIVGAVVVAYKYLHELALQQKITGESFVVLLTDGEQSERCSNSPICETAQECTDWLIQQEVPKAAGSGADIRTFAIGAPGSEGARQVLSEIALQGGTAPRDCDPVAGTCHFDMTRQGDFATALSDALTTITNKVGSCELPLPPPDDEQLDLTRVNVVYAPGDGADPRVIPQDTRASCEEGAQGWQYNSDSTRIVLCGEICDTVRLDAAAHLDVVLGCPAQTVI